MQRLGFYGAGAERAAAAEIRAMIAQGLRVVAFRPERSADGQLPEGARAFVARHGALWASDAFWLEWAARIALSPVPPEPSADRDVLVVVAHEPMAGMAERWTDTTDLTIPADRFGRPGATDLADDRPKVRIAILGDEYHHRHVSPAPLVRLGDAAERLGLSILPIFVRAAQMRAAGLHADIAGVVLPGGSDMDQVRAQVTAAGLLLDDGRPVFGLCLGMQSMATALMRRGGWRDAMPEEVVGRGPERSFVRLREASGAAVHRLGEVPFQPRPRTRLAQLMPHGGGVRMNHRYRLNPDFPVERLRHVVFHAATTGDVIDAIEVTDHPFFIGLQGHPEFGVGPGLAGLWDAFLTACAERARMERVDE